MTPISRLIAAAVAVIALLATACSAEEAAPPQTTADTAQPAATAAPAATTSAPEPDLEPEAAAASAPDTGPETTTVSTPDSGPASAEPEQPAESAAVAPEGDSSETETEPAPEQSPDDSTPVEDAGEGAAGLVTEPEPGPDLETDDTAAVGDAPDPGRDPEDEPETRPEPEGVDDQPEPAPETDTEPEPDPGGQPEAADGDIVCLRADSGDIVCPQAIPDDYGCESTDTGMVCRPPGSGSEPQSVSETVHQPEEAVEGDIVCSPDADGNVVCPQDIPADYSCESAADGGVVCHPPGWEPEPGTTASEPDVVWIPPVAGMVPQVHPDTPLSEWQRGDGSVDPNGIAYDKPRATAQVVAWVNWACEQTAIRCELLLHEMKQALDYLGANPRCVLNMYTERVNYHVRQGQGADWSYSTDTFGWHMCATVIDPVVAEIPDGPRDNDEGLRLSDTSGITLAERCRRVLPGDIELETRGNEVIRPESFGSDCDAWARWIERDDSPFRSFPACNASLHLAEEWMEHHHNQHERYFRPHC